ncbi:DeoR/GlpR transcriptional regulator [Candidatus Bipolaricaulota bacterium]|nr:DeoR/GlpR transcriptional regulator [Candidatus Bipolaricaulota bacterium]
MLVDERRHRIAEVVIAQGVATVAELSKAFGVSHVTIRSDLEALGNQGVLQRNRGGAVANPTARFTPAFQERSSVNKDAKQAIAKMAADLVGEGDWLILDAGSTALYVADHFMNRQMTIAVNSTYTANKLVDAPNVDLIHIGGSLYRPSLSFVGKLAEAHLDELRFDRVLLGVNGVSETGISVNNVIEVGIKRQMIDSATEVIVLADSSKLGIESLARIAPLDQIHKLVTNKEASPEILKRIRKAQPELEVLLA